MSKRNSAAVSNTLFNYFTKTPPSNKKTKQNEDEDINKLNTTGKNDVKTESKLFFLK